ncbi:MAG: DUF3145 family protein [Actinobacteria bacterium]|nr:DUF3145 family protein [Actinomycetota bacterium]
MGWGRSHLRGRYALIYKEQLLITYSPSEIGYCHGRLNIYSCPKTLIKHLETGLERELNESVNLNWQNQVLKPGSYRGQMSYSSAIGSGARIVNTLKSWSYLIFELSEFNFSEGSIYFYTKELGLYRGSINSLGQIIVSEDLLKSAITQNLIQSDLTLALEKLMGRPWDDFLEPFRRVEIEAASTLADRLSV